MRYSSLARPVSQGGITEPFSASENLDAFIVLRSPKAGEDHDEKKLLKEIQFSGIRSPAFEHRDLAKADVWLALPEGQ
ncbi:hypothetical protein [Novosphingobium sp.]|uniref:hypothetical protein n=1 Tax=Novosphingobium sp. TaxID=1874826 RepID=UPI0028B1E564|nr:hypothetical protein [Novosphingobium sp.]